MENLACSVFLLPSFWDSPFCLTTNQFIFREELSITSIDSNITDNINLYLVNVPILCPLKTAENTWNLWKKPVSVSTETITWLDISNGGETEQHCVKSVRIRSYSGSHFPPHFPAFGLNTGRYGVSLRIQSECGKIRARNTSAFGRFSGSICLWSILSSANPFQTNVPLINPIENIRNQEVLYYFEGVSKGNIGLK